MQLFGQATGALPPSLDWQQLAAVYGPLIGVLAVVLKMHWDMMHKTIPVALETVRAELRKNRVVIRRLIEHLTDTPTTRPTTRPQQARQGHTSTKPRSGPRRKRKSAP